jgi:hypothetical protein
VSGVTLTASDIAVNGIVYRGVHKVSVKSKNEIYIDDERIYIEVRTVACPNIGCPIGDYTTVLRL